MTKQTEIVSWSRRVTFDHPGRALVACAGAGYAYWATGLRPFTGIAYLAVGIPVAICGVVLVVRGSAGAGHRAGRIPTRAAAIPWLVLAAAVASLEGIGLALGGRSRTVPTLSTVVDHALAWHASRMVLFCGWLLIGVVPAARAVARRGEVR